MSNEKHQVVQTEEYEHEHTLMPIEQNLYFQDNFILLKLWAFIGFKGSAARGNNLFL